MKTEWDYTTLADAYLQRPDYSDAAIDATSSSLAKPTNPYLNVVSRLTPSDLISRFTSSASPRVQDAV